KVEGKDHAKNDELQKLIKPIYEDYVISAQKTQLFGKMVNEIQKEKDKLFYNTFDPRDFTIEFDEFDNIVLLKVQEHIKHFKSGSTLEERVIEEKNFNFFRFEYRKGKRERNNGLSYLEGSYDAHVGIQNLMESGVYFVIRVGAGLKIIYVPMDKMNDDEYMADLELNIQTMNAENTTMILGIDENGVKTEVQLLTGQPIDFNQLLVFYYKFISVKSGVPVTILEGVTPGQLEGGKINETLLFDVLAKIQKRYEPLLRWVIGQILPELAEAEYDIEWITREAVDEKSKQELLKQKLENLETLTTTLTVKFDKAAQMVELELTEEDLDTELIEEKRKTMNNLFNSDSTDEDTDESDKPDSESTSESEDSESTEEEED
ncbi:hypothetical protein LCGC14_1559240, partial [marine sediment metagenome]